jgi:hypothetical protein
VQLILNEADRATHGWYAIGHDLHGESGENLLGLGRETEAILAQYDVGGAAAQLLLVQYPGAEAAAGLAALEASQIDGLVAASARGDLLGAVFGEVDAALAQGLLEKALQ